MSGHKEETFDSGIDFQLWKRLFRYTKPYRRDVAFVIGGGVLVALMDVALPLVTRRVIDDAAEFGLGGSFLAYAPLYGLCVLLLCAGIYIFIRYAGKVRTHVSHDIRRDGFDTLQELSFSFFDQRPVGWLMARMTSDCERLSNILAWGVLDFAWGMTVLTGIGIVMFVLDWQLALVVLAVIPLLAWISAVFKKRILGSSRLVRKTNSRITASYNECIMGVRTSKVFVRENANAAEFRDLTTTMYGASVRNMLQSALYLPIVLTLGSLAAGGALAAGGYAFDAGRLTIGTLIAFLSYTRHFFDPVHEMAHWFAEMQMAQASAERVMGLIHTVPEIRDGPDVTEGPPRIGTVEFRDVGFSYRDGTPVLSDFNLTVEPGETIALVGATGGGKTTIVNLMCRFYEPTCGTILVDGVDYKRRPLHWLQSGLGIVLQEPHLFSGSVGENIRYGRLDATDAEVEAAARLVGAHDFIAAMEDGYRSEVGEGGVRLSTGQKQLLSFARAILAEPQLLVMDEATSSVDTETEQHIQAGLARVLSGRTSFVIAHRLSTIRNADRILVIDHGRIVEQGPHGELLALRGRYHDLYTQQSLVARWEPE